VRSLVNFINILPAAFAPLFLRQKKLQSQTVTREKLRKKLAYEKVKHKTNVDEIDTRWIFWEKMTTE